MPAWPGAPSSRVRRGGCLWAHVGAQKREGTVEWGRCSLYSFRSLGRTRDGEGSALALERQVALGTLSSGTQQKDGNPVFVHRPGFAGPAQSRGGFYSHTRPLPAALPCISASFPRSFLHTSHPLCHFSLPALKLALGESFLVLTVEQILFNLTMEIPPVLLAPFTPSLLPPLHCDKVSLSTQ